MKREMAVVALVTLMTTVLAGALPALAQDSPPQTPSAEATDNQGIAQTLTALRTLLQNTESRLEHVETRLDAHDERVRQLRSRVEDLQGRVEGQMSILSERVSSQQSDIRRHQTIGVLAVVILLGILVAGLVAQARRLRALEALQDHVGRGVEQDDAEEPSQ